jgi:hypothetical protein
MKIEFVANPPLIEGGLEFGHLRMLLPSFLKRGRGRFYRPS